MFDRRSPLPPHCRPERSARLADARGARHGGRSAVLVGAVVTALLLAGCARFDESQADPFSPEPTRAAHAELDPPTAPPTSPGETTNAPATGPCIDPNSSVIETCLESTGGLVVLPDALSALVTERLTGRILRVEKDTDPVEFARIDTDASTTDGGLLAVALSPTYSEDRLVYAYVTTPTDNRVVRITTGDTPKTILSGIPRGSTGNGAAITFDATGALLVRTGDAGNPGAAANPASLAGKLLRLPNPTPGQTGAPEVLGSGLGPGGVCIDPITSTVWVTNRAATEDQLLRLAPGGGLQPVWTWAERPGVGHCAAIAHQIGISLDAGVAVTFVETSPDTGLAVGDPVPVLVDTFGHLLGAALGADGTMWASTINKSRGTAVSTDDRVVIVPFPGGGAGASGPD